MRKIIILFFIMASIFSSKKSDAQKGREFYQVTVYHFNSSDQENAIDAYLKNAMVPALHRKSIKNVGVFKPRANDTAADKRIYVITPIKHLEDLSTLTSRLLEDQQYLQNGRDYLDAPYDKPPYLRMENIVVRAFELAPKMNLPQLTSPK